MNKDCRKKILVNDFEVATEAALREAAARCNARVFSKVGLDEVLDLTCGLTKEEYWYARWAHFDFVVASADTTPVFAVEFDGPSHSSNAAVKERDQKKNAICEKLGMPLFRIDSAYLKWLSRFSLIGWITETWFQYEAWCQAQESGDILVGEPFLYFLSPGADPFISSRAFIERSYQQQRCLTPFPEELFAVDTQGYANGLAIVNITAHLTILGSARCRFFMVPPIPSIGQYEVVGELAMVDAAEKLKRYQEGVYQPAAQDDVRWWRDRFARWNAQREHS
jgi:hypothetical protein